MWLAARQDPNEHEARLLLSDDQADDPEEWADTLFPEVRAVVK